MRCLLLLKTSKVFHEASTNTTTHSLTLHRGVHAQAVFGLWLNSESTFHWSGTHKTKEQCGTQTTQS